MKYPLYKIVLVVCDFILIQSSFFAAMLLHRVSSVRGDLWASYLKSPEFVFVFFLALFIVLIFQSRDLYKLHIIFSRTRQILTIFLSIGYSMIVLSVLAFFLRSPWIIDSRLAVIYFAGICFVSVTTFRFFVFRPLYVLFNKNEVTKKKVVIVGTSIAAKSFAVEMKIGNIYGFQLVGFVDDQKEIGRTVYGGYGVLGKSDDIPRIVEQYDVDEIIIAESGVNYENLLHIIDVCKSTRAHVNVASPLFEVVHKKFSVDSYFDLPVAPLRSVSANDHILLYKRLLDIVGSVAGLLLLSIPLAVIALIVKLSSEGPVFYKQVRIGKDGKPFNFYKFRSMKLGSDQDLERVKKMQDFIRNGVNSGNGSTKMVNESMITPIGKLLRKTSLDELPQLYNVLRGDMSLVGPRPCLPYEYEAYDEWHKRRLSVLPGCTGLWQVSGRSETDFDEMVVLDLYYIGNISPILDLQLILKTIPVMIFGRGAK
ncbi:MAG: sugar transferase [Bacteroidota bacterium]